MADKVEITKGDFISTLQQELQDDTSLFIVSFQGSNSSWYTKETDGKYYEQAWDFGPGGPPQ